ncbi:MAG TPA: hypothetical protein VJU16_04445, partial [Planctomycetota bacterium]|nr:hypothetical protein [Planctomycetota bacterium]
MNRPAILALVLLAACAPRRERPPQPVIPVDAIINRLDELEDARRLEGLFMSEAASHASPEVRERLAVALGRIMKPESFPLFVVIQIHSKPAEWKSLVFAAGQMGLAPDGLSPENTRDFLKLVTNTLKEPNEALRALSVEAIGKLALDQAPGLAAPLLKDPSPLVRRQAATACFRW